MARRRYGRGKRAEESVCDSEPGSSEPRGRGGRHFSTSESAGGAGPGAGRGRSSRDPGEGPGARGGARASPESGARSGAAPCPAQVRPPHPPEPYPAAAAVFRRAPASFPSAAAAFAAAASAPRSARMARAVPENGGARERRPGRGGRVPACRLPVPGAAHRVAAQFQVRVPGRCAPPFSPG